MKQSRETRPLYLLVMASENRKPTKKDNFWAIFYEELFAKRVRYCALGCPVVYPLREKPHKGCKDCHGKGWTFNQIERRTSY